MATFTAGEIQSVSFGAFSPDIGFSGISTSNIDVTLINKTAAAPACQKGDKIRLSGAGLFPDFYVSDRTFDTYTTSFTAYDSCCKLDKEFDNSTFVDSVKVNNKTTIKYYTQTEVISAINTQLGITVTPPADIGIRFQKSDLSGTIRSILEQIAQINGCMFVCTTSNTIQAVLYQRYIATANVSRPARCITLFRCLAKCSPTVHS